MSNQEQLVAEIAQEVIARLRLHLEGKAPAENKPKSSSPPASGGDGVFATVDEAVKAAAEAQRRVAEMSLEERGRIIAIIRRLCTERADELGRMELDETKIGRVDHKIAKLQAMRHVVGIEAMRRVEARSDASGLCVVERAPWGVIGMKRTRYPVLSVQAKFVATRRWPTESANFNARGSLAVCA